MLQIWRLLSICCIFISPFAQAVSLGGIGAPSASPSAPADKESPMHWGGDESTLNRKTNLVELRGNAYVIRDNEEVHADEIDLNLVDHKVWARSRVRYQYGDYIVRADQIYLDLVHKTGTVTNGNVTNGHFALRGSSMEQVGEKRFLVKDFDYTTCMDCTNSWEMTGKSADLTIDQYAFMDDFTFKIKDVSAFWLPYMVIPVKSKRESGILFPRFGANSLHGAEIVVPYFWAINDSADMTIGLGDYFVSGSRVEWEGRYALTDLNQGVANFYYTNDHKVAGLYYRYGINASATQELPWGFEAKLHYLDVSDSGYPVEYAEDMPGRYESALSSDLSFSNNDPSISTIVDFRLNRNLLLFDSLNNYTGGFDGNAVQELPRIVVNTNDQFIFGSKVAAGVEARFNRFARSAGPFDQLTDQSGNPFTDIRVANRFTLIPNLYTTLNPWPWLSVVPSLEYRTYIYNFDGAYPDLARGYLLGQVETSLQLEKVYHSDDPTISYKHTIRPTLTYSTIPRATQMEPAAHPFITQIQNQARPGSYFDDSDIVPINATQNLDSYFKPLGNSLTYGFTTEWFRKEQMKDGSVAVAKKVEFGLEQTLDISEINQAITTSSKDDRILLSPLFTHLQISGDKFGLYSEYTYYSFLDQYKEAQLLPFTSPHRFLASVSYTAEHAIHDQLLLFDRSATLSYSFSKLTAKISNLSMEFHYSINDYFMPIMALAYNLVENVNQSKLSQKYGFVFQSPSHCWRTDAAYTKSIDQGESITFSFGLNLAGNAFGGMDSSAPH